MKLKHLEIELQASYRPNAGKYEAKITFENEHGEIKMVLEPEISAALLSFIGPTVTQFSSAAAKRLENDIALSVAEARQAPALEAATS